MGPRSDAVGGTLEATLFSIKCAPGNSLRAILGGGVHPAALRIPGAHVLHGIINVVQQGPHLGWHGVAQLAPSIRAVRRLDTVGGQGALQRPGCTTNGGRK